MQLDPTTDANWRILFPAGAGTLTYISSPVAKDALIPGVKFVSLDADGFGIYQIDPATLR